MANDPAVSEEKLWALLFSLEDEASNAMALWLSCQ